MQNLLSKNTYVLCVLTQFQLLNSKYVAVNTAMEDKKRVYRYRAFFYGLRMGPKNDIIKAFPDNDYVIEIYLSEAVRYKAVKIRNLKKQSPLASLLLHR